MTKPTAKELLRVGYEGEGGMKKLHPIRKMSRQVWGKDNWSFLDGDERYQSDKVIARHVKPLLDALALEHKGWPEAHFGLRCKTCNLLAEWRDKL